MSHAIIEVALQGEPNAFVPHPTVAWEEQPRDEAAAVEATTPAPLAASTRTDDSPAASPTGCSYGDGEDASGAQGEGANAAANREAEPEREPSLELKLGHGPEQEPERAESELSDDEGSEWDDPDMALREFGRRPVMDRVQEALYTQLLQTYERVSEELRGKEGDLKRTKAEREAVGVELYAVQQQLARLQLALEQAHARAGGLADDRARCERELGAAKELFQGRRGEAEELERQRAKSRAELNALRETLRHVERYLDEMKGEILVTRRATYKAEQAVQGLEKDKGRQDFYLDGLVERARQLQAQAALYESELDGRNRSGATADAVLRETAREMSVVAFEKKQLLQQWRSALVGLARRDEAITVAAAALRDAQAAARDYDVEIDGVRREISAAQAKNEALVGVKDRLGSEDAFVEGRLVAAREERAKLSERFALLQRSLVQVEGEEKEVDAAAKQLAARGDAQQAAVQAVTSERVRIEDEASAHKGEQSTASKAVRGLRRRAAAAVVAARAAESEEAALLNELARIGVDSVNTEAHNGQLRATLAAQSEQLAAHDALVQRYRQEIRQRNDEVEKKMLRVDRLNGRYEKLLDGRKEPEGGGPLEATIANLGKEVSAMEEANGRAKQAWLHQQTSLVAAVAATEGISEENTELRARASILGQRRLRLLAEAAAADAELKRLAAAAAGAHLDMSRLNELIGKSGRAAGELEDATALLEKGFMRELRELEAASVAADERLRAAREAKAAALDEIVEVERQAMLWAKKTQIERETQAALNPDEGKGEVRSMEREIHRMKVRLEGLQRQRELMVREMERAVARREQIAGRSRDRAAVAAARPGAAEVSRAAVAKRVDAARRKVHEAAAETERHEAAAAERKARLDELAGRLAAEGRRHAEATARRDSLQKELGAALYEKQRRAELAGAKRRLARRYADAARGGLPPGLAAEAAAAAAVASGAASGGGVRAEQTLVLAEARLAAVRDVIEQARGRVEGLDDVLDRVMGLVCDVTQ